MAVPGYNTKQEVEMLKYKGLSYNPDIVILGWCDNDFNPPFFVYKRREFNKWNKSYLYSYIFYRNAGFFMPEIKKPDKINKDYVDPSILDYCGKQGVKKALDELKNICNSRNTRLLVFGSMGQDITNLCKELDIDYCNIALDIKPGTYPEEYEIYYMHPRAEGHRVLGEYLANLLIKKGWIK